MIPANSALVELPKRRHREMSALTSADAARFIVTSRKDRFGLLFELLLVTGARLSEALAWTWADLDLEHSSIATVRTLVRVDGAWQLADTKTPRSRRSVPLSATLVRHLQEHRRVGRGATPLGSRVRGTRTYLRITDRGSRSTFITSGPATSARFSSARGYPIPAPLRSLALCASLLLAAGEHPKVVSGRLGHAPRAITLDVYSHVVPSMQRAATEKLEELLSEGGG